MRFLSNKKTVFKAFDVNVNMYDILPYTCVSIYSTRHTWYELKYRALSFWLGGGVASRLLQVLHPAVNKISLQPLKKKTN